jgi:ribosome-associated protein
VIHLCKVNQLNDADQSVCDYFVICEGTSNTQVGAIVNSIRKQVSKAIQDKPIHIEGTGNSEWVLMDYGNVVVHVFQKHIRDYYDIEGLWGDAITTELTSKN